jgi:hypothetical protein
MHAITNSKQKVQSSFFFPVTEAAEPTIAPMIPVIPYPRALDIFSIQPAFGAVQMPITPIIRRAPSIAISAISENIDV